MGTDFKENNIINPLPQRMVRHTHHDKEYTCLLKGKKKCTFLFFVRFKKFDQVARKCLGVLCTPSGGLTGRDGLGSAWLLRGRLALGTAQESRAGPPPRAHGLGVGTVGALALAGRLRAAVAVE